MRRIVLCALLILAVTACGDDRVQSSAASAPAAAAPGAPAATAAVPTSVVAQSLAFSAPRVGGGTINLADYAGTPVLLWFWAPT